jgi:tetratricopeptide (TPR) repeat protein
MLLDLIASNNWERPIYFTSPAAIEKVLDVDEYCHLEGVVYRFLPVKADHVIQGLGGIDTEETYDLLVDRARWGNLEKPGVYIDPESRRNSIMPKQNYLRLAQALMDEGDPEKAIKTLDTLQKYFPHDKIPWDIYMVPMVETYYDAKANDKANAAADILLQSYTENLDYYASLDRAFRQYYNQDIEQSILVMQQLSLLAARAKENEQAKKIDDEIQRLIDFFD